MTFRLLRKMLIKVTQAEDRQNLRFGVVAATIVNNNPFRKQKQALKASDFFKPVTVKHSQDGGSTKPQSWQQQLEMVKAWHVMFGGSPDDFKRKGKAV